MHISRNTDVQPTDISMTEKSPASEWIMIAVCSAFYIALSFFLRDISTHSTEQMKLFGMVLSNHDFSGIVSQAQILFSAYLTISTRKKGMIAAILLNLTGIVFALFGIIYTGELYALSGIISYFGSIIICIVIYYYKKGLLSYFKRLSEQKEEITSLYEEISASQDKMSKQNEQLVKYNRLMNENKKQLEYMAFYDTLTGLPNRKMIIKKLDMLIHYSGINNTGFSFIYIDIDNFKEVNDLMGHQIGDKILQIVAERLKKGVDERDVVGRLGGDEFALIVRRELSRDEILKYADSFKSAIAEVCTCDNKEFYINASFGISIFPVDGETTEDLLKNADIAMHSIKRSGKNGISFFCSEMQISLLKRSRIENGLKSAVNNEELYLVFQPQYYCDTGRIRGFEALCRWNSESLGHVSPAQFIPIAEETGLIIEIGEWILRTVMHRFREMQEASRMDFKLTINISVVQIVQPSFLRMVKKVLQDTQFDSKYLEFEITESVLISYPEKVVDTLNQLREMGISIALDDFGTGYASLKYLQMLPIDTLKIDRTFVSRIGETDHGNQIIGSIIWLAHSLGITVIAEGVENAEQLEYLKKQNCDCLQGYLLSRPLEEEQFSKLIG
ncbi:MAG: bifunctional diguanylate cyclase/phosphodiesterase [Clostridiaceae bacterium]|jgi:diguanylate cyclase (GGDEF)-like protein|nr:bifunctional diguanylate cyclase/phosphodiesterase [Clostridiaceae bacterium]